MLSRPMGVSRASRPAAALHERFARRNGVPAVAATVFDVRGPVDVLVAGVRRRGGGDAALVVCNDGRNRVLNRSAALAAKLLSRPETSR